MTTFFTALFFISIAGLTILFWSKHVETKLGRRFFLPVALHDHDMDLEQYARRFARASITAGKQTARSAWRLSCAGCKHLWHRVREVGKSRSKQLVENNGGGSVYLKQMMEHKNEIRNGNNHS